MFLVVVQNMRKDRTGFPPIDSLLDIAEWISENPDKAIIIGTILTFIGIGVSSASAIAGSSAQKAAQKRHKRHAQFREVAEP